LSFKISTNCAYLCGKVFFHHIPPDLAAFTGFVRTPLQESQLTSALPHEFIQPLEFCCQFYYLSLLAFHAYDLFNLSAKL